MEESKLKYICETEAISLDEAQMALELADGEIERALELVPYVEKSMILIHGKFVFGRTQKLYGIFRVLAQGKEATLLEVSLAMSYVKNELDAPLSANPEAFQKIIEELSKETQITQVHSFLAGFYKQIKAAKISRMYHFIKEDQKQELNDLFNNLISKLGGGVEKVEVKLKTFLMTRVQCEKKGFLESESNILSNNVDSSSGLTIYLETEPIISPLKGKTIEKFSIEEFIPLKIIDHREAGTYLGKVLSDESGIAFAKIKEIQVSESSNRHHVTVEFGSKINGRFVIEPSVRIATFSGITNDANNSKTVKSTEMQSLNFIVIGALVIFLFMILFILTR
ncbi:MAG: DUF4899 domain-containing protein [Halanaerobiales bacterium]|nr:DUF4899 domain-containing protein [Halanaerobiales bacterium]